MEVTGQFSNGPNDATDLSTQQVEDNKEDYWKFYNANDFEPHTAFVEEEEPSLDLDDW